MLVSGLSKTKPLVLSKAKGKINLVRDTTYSTTTHTHSHQLELHIGRHSFDVEDDLAEIMMQGEEYIVYYERDWEEIVAAELLSPAE